MLIVGSGSISLKCLVRKDLTTATDFGIHYEKPSGTRGTIDVALGATLHEGGKAILFDVDDDTFFDEAGMWKFQSFAIFDGSTSLGAVEKIKVHENIIP